MASLEDAVARSVLWRPYLAVELKTPIAGTIALRGSRVLLGLCWGYIWVILGLYWGYIGNKGKENGSYYMITGTVAFIGFRLQ